ncbi:CshA/CshB family fibrillar adhesin-related protein [Demequina activiva]|uniref:CshA/CshB family fibrillar adhesin-related protein n=1 Tax=Demequina activiva TaxID=1582364 RepID=UPI00194277C4|nr:CshA/CshB family fibrillar adhesin-related protein [Demequina activiva]
MEWVSWGAHGTSLVPTAGTISRVETFVAGGQTFETRCVISNLVRLGGTNQSGKDASALISAWRSGTWQGDGFDNLYTLPAGAAAGILNIHDGNTIEFDIDCAVEWVVSATQRVPVPGTSLVMAQAESAVTGAAGSGTVQEYIGATAPAGSTWRVLERIRGASCTQQTYARQTAAGGGTRLELRGAANDTCEGSTAALRPNPTVVALADGAMSATDVTIRGRGYEAVAFGVVLPFDFGDAPAGYGVAGALATAKFSGGTVPNYTSGTGTEMFGSFALAQRVQPDRRLGSAVTFEQASLHSATAAGDANDDAVAAPGTLSATPGTTYTLSNVQCQATAGSPAHVAGWIDWHGDGTFDPEDKSSTVACPTGGGAVSLDFAVPTTLPATTTVASFLRLRTAPTSVALEPTGMTLEGEVEDYAVTLEYPATPVLELEKTHTGGEVAGGQTLTFSLEVTNSGNVTLTTVAVSDPTATVSGCSWASLAPGASGTCTATYAVDSDDLSAGFVTNTATATAQAGGSSIEPVEDSATVYADLVAVDDAATTPVNVTVTRDAATGVLANDSGAGLTVTSADAVDAGIGVLTVDIDGSYTFVPATNYSGIVTADYTVASTSGASGSATLTITVVPAAADDSASTPFNTAVGIDVISNDSGATLAVIGTTDPSSGSVAVNGDGTVTYTPDTDFSGIDTFTYTARDDSGQEVTATVTVAVGPIAADDAETTPANTPVTIDAVANDSGTGLEIVGVTDPTSGMVVDNGDGTFLFTPEEDFSGTVTFDYVVEDDDGQQRTATVTVTVTPVAVDDADTTVAGVAITRDALAGVRANDAGSSLTVVAFDSIDPVEGTLSIAADGSYDFAPASGFSGIVVSDYTVQDDEDQQATATLTITVTPIAADDAASTAVNTAVDLDVVDNDTGSTLAVVNVSDPANGEVAINGDGTVTYTPDANFSGTDTFTYTVEDEDGQEATATVAVTVTPLAVDDAETTTANSAVAVSVLGNDVGATLDVLSITQPTNGAAVIDLDDTVLYTPADGFSGTDTFTYTAQDAEGQQATATVTITVTPLAVDDAATTAAGTAVVIDAEANDAGSSLDVMSVTQPTDGVVTINGDGTVEYAPHAGFSGTDTFTYTVEAADGQEATATVTVTVTPVATGDAASTPVNTAVDIDVVDNDLGTTLAVVDASDPARGEVTVNVDGTVTYTPDTDFSGTDTFTYTVEDAEGQQTTATVTVTVTPLAVDDAETTTADTAVVVDVLANDLGDVAAVLSITQPSNGAAVIDLDDTVLYTPSGSFSGTDTFTYTLVDAEGQESVATVTITVTPVVTDDAATTPAGTAVDVDVRANDAGTSLDVVSVTQPTVGAVTINADGTVEYVPDAGFSGTDTFTYTVRDDEGQQATATVTVTVTPVAADDAASTPVNTAVGIDVIANDSGATLAVIGATDPSNGSAAVNGDGTVTYTPDTDFSGTDTFTYTVEDAEGQQATATVTVTVSPIAVDDAETTTANTAVSVTVLANDDGSALELVSITEPSDGTAVINVDDTVLYTPDTDFSGTDTFTYTVEDAEGQQVTATVTVTVTPTALDDVDATDVDTAVSRDAAAGVLSNDAGSDLTVVSFSAVDAASGSLAINGDGSYTFTPASGFSGVVESTYVARDGSGQETTATLTIVVAAGAVDDAGTTPANTTLTVDDAAGVLANDVGSDLEVIGFGAIDSAEGSLTIAADGSYVFVPATGTSGVVSSQYTARDSSGFEATATLTITVTPTAADDAASTSVDTPVDIDARGGDVGTSLDVVSVTQPADGVVTINGDGTVEYEPNPGYSGIDVFTYTVEDADGQQATATVTVTVTPVAADDAASTLAGTAVDIDVEGNDAGTTLTVVDVSDPTDGSVTDNGDGTVTYTPDAGFSGTDTFTYTVEDADGQEATATVTVTVTPVATDDAASTAVNTAVDIDVVDNDLGTTLAVVDVSDPANGEVTLNVDGTLTYTADTDFSGIDTFIYAVEDAAGQRTTATVTVTVTPAAASDAASTQVDVPVDIDVLDNDRGTALDVVSVTQPADGVVTINGDGTVEYAPDAGFSGTDTFTYTAEDADGQQVSAVVVVSVAPTAADDAATTPAGTAVDIVVDGNDAGTLLDVVSVSDAANGAATVNGDGTVTYTPDAGFSGTDTFTYTVRDDKGQEVSATVTVTVTPVAANDAASTAVNTAVDIDVVDNDLGTTLAVVDVSDPADGEVTINSDGTVTYTPDTDFSGADSFTYTVQDAEGQEVTATVTVAVTPLAASDAASTQVDVAVDIDVLDNDHGSALEVVAVTQPADGVVTITADGSVEYTPNPGYSGIDSFTYTVEDAAGQQVSAAVAVRVTPTAADDASFTTADTSVDIEVLANDVGTDLTVASVTEPAHGAAVVNSDDTIAYTPAAGFSGTDTFTYTARDADGQEVAATVTVVVRPVAVDDAATAVAGGDVTIRVRDNDAGTGLSVVSVTDPDDGVVSVTAEGHLIYTAPLTFSGTATFTYTVEDAEGQESTATVTVTVLPRATDNRVATPGGTPLRIGAGEGLLGNDGGTGIRVVGHAPMDAQYGTLVLDTDGSLVFTPRPGFSGEVSVEYTIIDAAGQTATALLVIEVGEDPPLVLTSVVAQCVAEIPYLSWNVALPDGFPEQGTNPLTVTFVNPEGDDYVVSDLPLQGRMLWPGASDGDPLQWPGWERLSDGTYVETDGNFAWTREDTDVLFQVNPEAVTTVSYPPTTSACANASATGSAGGGDAESETDGNGGSLALTGTDAGALVPLAAALAGLGALFLVVARRRRN